MSCFLDAARKEYAPAQLRVGQAHRWGEVGVPQDRTEAARWYRKAADQGHPEAQHI